MKTTAARGVLLICIVVSLLLVGARPPALEAGIAAVTENYPNCRFGVTAQGEVEAFDTESLNLGWYVDWGIDESPLTPGGMEFVQIVRLSQKGTDGWDFRQGQSWASLTEAINANPGALWLIGNEPDSPFQDDMVPEAYAHAYHDLYGFIKGLDATAKVGIGGIVQPTPLRFDYLDAVWSAYHETYGETMPVDVWNIHSFILRETTIEPDPEPCGDKAPVWGAFVPPDSAAQTGELYCVRDQDNLDIFWQRIREFRRWMAAKGQRDKPLIITEYGVLFYEDYFDEDGRPFSQDRVGRYMTGTFDLMLGQTDPLIGYSYDGNRLVQRWAWFSLNGDPHDWGGTLFDPDTHEIRPLGEHFRDYASTITATVDLFAARAFATPAAFWHQDVPVTTTLTVVVSNMGNVSTTLPIEVTFYDGIPGENDTQPIGSAQTVVGGLKGCADYDLVSVTWTDLDIGAHSFYVQVDGQGTIVEEDETNNVASGIVLVATERVFLPLAPESVN